jgi:Spy/CpxP family protein refolding chaperone
MTMKPSMIRKTVILASLAGALALAPVAVAYAHDAKERMNEHRHAHRGGLVGSALKLDSLTAEQRASIESLAQQRRAASTPVRQADALVLTALAQQVEQARIDPQALAPTMSAEQSAAATETAVDRDTLNRLHAVLTPAQRGQLVDRIEASRGQHPHERAGEENKGRFGRGLDLTPEQRAQIVANLRAEHPGDDASAPKGQRGKLLEAFRGDSFDASAFVNVHSPGERMEKLAAAMVPVLSPSQRAAFANHLRTRASHESTPKGA